MKITIHKGTQQIGGCITEVESQGYRVFIDFGEQLPGVNKNKIESIEGLTIGDISKSALLITHYHGDHIGRIAETSKGLPIYMGKTTKRIFEIVEQRLGRAKNTEVSQKHKLVLNRLKTVQTFSALQKIVIGHITVIPLFVDHSAFDSYMFIIEADNKRIIHTGDFRGHGFRSKGLIPTLKKFATDIDVIISEGSNVERPKAAIKTEHELQREFERDFKKFKYNFVLISSTNVDRIFGLYHAAKKTGLSFVCDEYQAKILKEVSKNHKLHSSFYDIDFMQNSKPDGRFFEMKGSYLNPIKFRGKLKDYLEGHGFCMLIRSSETFRAILNEYGSKEKARLYYSLWKGYLDKEHPAFNKNMYEFLYPNNYQYSHTSGHADNETLRQVFKTVKPRKGIMPIHTEAPDKFMKVFGAEFPILHVRDGQVYTV